LGHVTSDPGASDGALICPWQCGQAILGGWLAVDITIILASRCIADEHRGVTLENAKSPRRQSPQSWDRVGTLIIAHHH
jgi:hypothetical protein